MHDASEHENGWVGDDNRMTVAKMTGDSGCHLVAKLGPAGFYTLRLIRWRRFELPFKFDDLINH